MQKQRKESHWNDEVMEHPEIILLKKYRFCSAKSKYLAQKLCFWKGIIFIGVYVSVCLYVFLCVSLDYLKQFFTDFDETRQDDE